MPKVAVVILNWNGRKFLHDFLPSVINYSGNAQIVVADNASTDDSVLFVKNNFPSVTVIQNSSNGGFSQGYNEALKKVEADYYVLLNSDVEVTKGWIDSAIKVFENDSTVAACQPKILSYHQKDHFEYAGAAGGFIDKYGYPFCRGRIFDSIEKDNGQYNDACEIFWATGACLFIRSSVYHNLGGLDEDFFAHMEEIDLCWRIKNHGYRIMYVPQSTVYHVGGGTLAKINPTKTYLNFRNNLYLITKNHPRNFFYWKLFSRMVLDGIAGLKFLMDGDFAHFKAVIKAHFSFYSSFTRMYGKRKQPISDNPGQVYDGSIVYSYFVSKRKLFSKLDQSLISKRN